MDTITCLPDRIEDATPGQLSAELARVIERLGWSLIASLKAEYAASQHAEAAR